jgi:hypothetical protein
MYNIVKNLTEYVNRVNARKDKHESDLKAQLVRLHDSQLQSGSTAAAGARTPVDAKAYMDTLNAHSAHMLESAGAMPVSLPDVFCVDEMVRGVRGVGVKEKGAAEEGSDPEMVFTQLLACLDNRIQELPQLKFALMRRWIRLLIHTHHHNNKNRTSSSPSSSSSSHATACSPPSPPPASTGSSGTTDLASQFSAHLRSLSRDYNACSGIVCVFFFSLTR